MTVTNAAGHHGRRSGVGAVERVIIEYLVPGVIALASSLVASGGIILVGATAPAADAHGLCCI